MQHSKILIFGSDVIGSIYGGLLAKSGQDVTMLAIISIVVTIPKGKK